MSTLITSTPLCAWIALTITSYSLGIFQIYAFYQFLTMKHLIIVKKRYPQIVMIEAIALMIKLFLTEPLWANASLGAYYPEQYASKTTLPISTELLLVPALIMDHFIVNAEACRLWLIYFDLNYLQSSKDEKWKSQIDESFIEKDWFLQNKKYGNQQFVAIRVFIYYLVSTCLCCAMFILFGSSHYDLAQLVDAILYLLPMSIILYIYCKSPKNEADHFLFHFEFKTTTIVFWMAIISYFILTLIELFGYGLINRILTTFLAVWCLAVPSLLSTFIIPRKISSSLLWSKKSASKIRKNVESLDEFKKSLNETLCQNRTFLEFVEFISCEFCLEIILSMIEITQFQNVILQKMGSENTNNQKIISLIYPSNTVPLSSIVHGPLSLIGSEGKDETYPILSGSGISSFNMKEMNDDKDGIQILKVKAFLLYKKYIRRNSPFEVNISSSVRTDLVTKMDDIMIWMNDKDEADDKCNTLDSLLFVFQNVMDEQYSLLIASFVRFITMSE